MIYLRLFFAFTVLAALLGGCVNVRTGNDEVDGTLYGLRGIAEAKGTREKQVQKDFEQDLEKQREASNK
jgi:hypothetical protein